jgi:hypothetical protein
MAATRGIGRRLFMTLVVSGISLAIAPAAWAATVYVGPAGVPGSPLFNAETVYYQAAAGEPNDVLLFAEVRTGDSVTVRDAGAVVVPGASCESLDAHTARCRVPVGSFPSVLVALDDMNDTLRTGTDVEHGGYTADGISVIANAGPGDDVLDARHAIRALLDGGGGRDRLRGAPYDDLLTDGDRDDASGAGAPDSDVIDGGPGADLISYRQRTAPVSVDLADTLPDGGIGEGDMLRRIESITGGSGDDRLAGNHRGNALYGGPGRDTLIGRGGFDLFGFKPPPEAIGPERLHPPFPIFGDASRCGHGFDRLSQPHATDFVERSCEIIAARGGMMRTRPRRTRTRTGLRYSVLCLTTDFDDWESPRKGQFECSGSVTLREAFGSRRLLAVGRRHTTTGVMTAWLRLTAVGRRVATRPRAIRATLRIRGENVPRGAWTIQLRLRPPPT